MTTIIKLFTEQSEMNALPVGCDTKYDRTTHFVHAFPPVPAHFNENCL